MRTGEGPSPDGETISEYAGRWGLRGRRDDRRLRRGGPGAEQPADGSRSVRDGREANLSNLTIGVVDDLLGKHDAIDENARAAIDRLGEQGADVGERVRIDVVHSETLRELVGRVYRLTVRRGGE